MLELIKKMEASGESTMILKRLYTGYQELVGKLGDASQLPSEQIRQMVELSLEIMEVLDAYLERLVARDLITEDKRCEILDKLRGVEK